MADRILLVDDDEAFGYATASMLRSASFDVVVASSYADALPVIEDNAPLSLLVIDIMLPSVNGFALARMARMRRLGLKTIYMSAFDIPTDEALGAFLRKPFALDALMNEVNKALAKPLSDGKKP